VESPVFLRPVRSFSLQVPPLPGRSSCFAATPLSEKLPRDCAPTPPDLTNSDDSNSCRPRVRHMDSMRAVRFTAGPITVKSSRVSLPILPLHDVADVQREAVVYAGQAFRFTAFILLGQRGLRAFRSRKCCTAYRSRIRFDRKDRQHCITDEL